MLENKAGVWLPIAVEMVEPGKEGKIIILRKFKLVFGVKNDETTSGTPVIMEGRHTKAAGQMWTPVKQGVPG